MATTVASTPDPNLDEMLKILDAASALRKERELVQEQLSVEEYRARLRDRLLAAAAAAGDPVRPEEVEVAIDTYFDRLHAYEDPALTPAVALAHLYVRRWTIFVVLALASVVLFLGWMAFRPPDPLKSQYTIEVVHDPGKKSGLHRYYKNRHSGYYLIVEARDSAGRPVKLPIRDSEKDNVVRTVSRWAERVPKEVYDRIATDKRSDGRLDEFVFAVKQRGRAEPEVRMVGPEGRPLTRLGQILEW
jgi:Family of unknown function (DUF6384)